ncbi:MAG: hypothetical protein V2I48_09475 [Xanthomonadales bacterium]|jgi:hypothetical protein|nr:hypothetical protein [Xanthomonadales bacterium]
MFRSTITKSRLGLSFGPFSVFIALFLAVSAHVMAQESGDTVKPEKLFESGETLELQLTGPWQEVVRDRDFQGAYPARMEYEDELDNLVTIDLSAGRRGVTRQRVCRIPPLRLRFEKGAAKGTVFRGQESLKMVTHCQKSSKYEQYYILEMLAYQMYNLLTDYSFRVRPLSVTYFQAEKDDTADSGYSLSKKEESAGPVFAFLIEDDKDVANRHDLDKLNVPRIKPQQLDSYEAALLALFQYMISNVDWAALSGPDPSGCCHNVKLIGPEPTKPEDTLYAIPYDFDSSGLVNSEYASPPQNLPVRSVTQRLYRGYCAHNPSLEGARQKMLATEQEIYALVNAESRLEPGRQKKAVKYLEGFFKIIKDDKAFQKRIVEKCRG